MPNRPAESMEQLGEICQPEDKIKTCTAYERLVLRKFSIYLTAFFLHLGITANEASMIGLMIGLCGAVLLGLSSIRMNFVGAILLQIAYLFDCVDGELARYEGFKTPSRKGKLGGFYLDEMNHLILYPLTMFLFGLGTAQYFPAWGRALSVLAFFGAFGLLGVPDLGMASIFRHTMRRSPEVMGSQVFRVLVLGRKSSKERVLEQGRPSHKTRLRVYIGEFLFFPGFMNNVTLTLFAELILYHFGFIEAAALVRLSVFCLLSLVYILNSVRIFRRNFIHLNMPSQSRDNPA